MLYLALEIIKYQHNNCDINKILNTFFFIVKILSTMIRNVKYVFLIIEKTPFILGAWYEAGLESAFHFIDYASLAFTNLKIWFSRQNEGNPSQKPRICSLKTYD